MKKNLSDIEYWWEYTSEEMLNYCLDNGIESIINDMLPKSVEYTLEDIKKIWDSMTIEYVFIDWPTHLLN
jgi:hypothetical protein